MLPQPGTPAGSGEPAADAVAPALSRLTLAPRTFRAAARSTVSFTLSEHARVTFTIRHAAPGRRSGGVCRAPRAANRAKPRCTRYVRLAGTLGHDGLSGANRVLLRGRLGRRTLSPGRYRLVARAVDVAGNRSAARRATFRIVAR